MTTTYESARPLTEEDIQTREYYVNALIEAVRDTFGQTNNHTALNALKTCVDDTQFFNHGKADYARDFLVRWLKDLGNINPRLQAEILSEIGTYNEIMIEDYDAHRARVWATAPRLTGLLPKNLEIVWIHSRLKSLIYRVRQMDV
ncbi:hypothetical protein FJZ39_03550 [Candidatus Saccharibacteria bacterium]|nr:hypothetical protein [Candidatus Saccharibacteria bacterium]